LEYARAVSTTDPGDLSIQKGGAEGCRGADVIRAEKAQRRDDPMDAKS